jgi:hypothetical protein
MGSYIIKDYFIFQMVHVNFKFSSPVMTFLLKDILASTKLWSLYRLISGGHKCGKLLRIMLQVTTCDICSRSKVPRHRPYGLLCPLPIPKKPWSLVSMDFIIHLPSSKAFDSIFVVVNWLTKMVHFMPCNKRVTGEEHTRLFMDNSYKYHDLPDNIISDHGS